MRIEIVAMLCRGREGGMEREGGGWREMEKGGGSSWILMPHQPQDEERDGKGGACGEDGGMAICIKLRFTCDAFCSYL